MQTKLFITCEHGGNYIPQAYLALFQHADAVLNGHRGYDIGALSIAESLSKKIADFYAFSTTSRLLVELNRSLHHPNLWSQYTQDLLPTQKEHILTEYYDAYREPIESAMEEAIQQHQRIIHISVHSFTPSLNGKTRQAEIGLLYDSNRKLEKQLCCSWQRLLKESAPKWRIRRNYPYRGSADGFTTYLRQRFPARYYQGIELEINQKLLKDENSRIKVKEIIRGTLAELKLKEAGIIKPEGHK